MKKAFGLFAAGVTSMSVFGAIAVYGQQGGSSNPGASASPGVLYPCPLITGSPGILPSGLPTGVASPGSILQCITVSIPQGAVGKGSAAYGTNPLTIPVGTTVTWVNNDTVAHTVTADNGSFDSGTLQPGQSYSRIFGPGTTGLIPYHCAIHGAASMSGALQVQAAGTAASPSPGASPSSAPGIAGGIVPVGTGGGTSGSSGGGY